MCNTGLILTIRKNEKARAMISEALNQKMLDNPDGFSFMETDKALSLTPTRTMDIKVARGKAESNSPLLFYHFRMASSGRVNIDSTHFWKRGQFYFAHNGGASIYGQYPTEAAAYPYKEYQAPKWKTQWEDDDLILTTQKGRKAKRALALAQKDDSVDSEVFFYRMIGKIKEAGDTRPATIAKIASSVNAEVWGRYQLLDSKKKRAYFIGDWYTYLINHDYMIITSAKMDFRLHRYIRGLPFGTINPEVRAGKIDGVWMLNMKQQRFKQIGVLDNYGG